MSSQVLGRLVSDASWEDSRGTLNSWLDGLLGNQPGYVALLADDGNRVDPLTGAVVSTTAYQTVQRSDIGRHSAVLLSATAATAAPTPANSVVLTEDAALSIGAGKMLRAYGPLGVSYGSLAGDNTGMLTASGSGTLAGVVTLSRLVAAAADNANYAIFGRNDGTGGLALNLQTSAGTDLLKVADAAIRASTHLLFVADNTFDIGAAGATRPRTAYLGTALAVGTTPAGSGAVRLANAAAVVAADAAGTGLLTLLASNASNQAILGSAAGVVDAIIQATTGAHIQIGGAEQVTVAASALTASANLLFGTDSTFDIGAAGANRPRDLYLARNAVITGDVTLTGAVWTTISPALTLTQSASVTPTINNARYRIFGKLAVVEIKITSGGAGTATNPIEIGTVPAILAPKNTGAGVTHGTFMVLPSSGAALRVGTAVMPTTTTIRCIIDNNANYLGATPGLTLAANDIVSATLIYELA